MKRKINFIFLILVFLSNISASPWSGLSDKIMDMRLPTNAEQFINVETKFSFSVPEEGEVKKTMIYGSPSGDGGDYFIPNFKVGSEVSLFIDMNTSLLKNIAKNVRSDEKSPTREILVEVCIEKSKDITVTQTGGVQPYSNKEDVNGNSFYFFIIKNNNELHGQVRFEFRPAKSGDAKITVAYSALEPRGLKIVDSSCDVFQTVKFNKNK